MYSSPIRLTMRLTSILPTLLLFTPSLAADSKPLLPCTIYRTETNAYYDISPIAVQPLVDHKKAHKDDRTESWHARGYDMGTNFTLNFCAPVIERIDEAVGIKESLVKNISAFYTWKEEVYSIGYVRAPKPEPAAFAAIAILLGFLSQDFGAIPIQKMLTQHSSQPSLHRACLPWPRAFPQLHKRLPLRFSLYPRQTKT